jgi:predicted secreted protein
MIFSAMEAGISILQLKYMREWEKASATVERLNLTVSVK